MDLPLARREPSPPDRVRHRIFPVPSFSRSNDLRHFLPSTQSPRTQLPFIFEHAHRQNFCFVCIDKPSRNVLSTKEMSFHEKRLRFLERGARFPLWPFAKSISRGSLPRRPQSSR